jgi:hypothetical protein
MAMNAITPVLTCDAPPPAGERLADIATVHKGTCFCGAVEIEATGDPLEMGYCHCGSCRAYSGAPLVAFILWEAAKVRVVRGAENIGGYAKTEMSDRQFCTSCGGHLMTGHPTLGFTDVYASILPSVAFRPVVHLHYAQTVLPVRDGLPKLRDFPAEVGGSGEFLPE